MRSWRRSFPVFPGGASSFDAPVKQVFGLAWREASESAWAEAPAAHRGVLGREGIPGPSLRATLTVLAEWLYGEASEPFRH